MNKYCLRNKKTKEIEPFLEFYTHREAKLWGDRNNDTDWNAYEIVKIEIIEPLCLDSIHLFPTECVI